MATLGIAAYTPALALIGAGVLITYIVSAWLAEVDAPLLRAVGIVLILAATAAVLFGLWGLLGLALYLMA